VAVPAFGSDTDLDDVTTKQRLNVLHHRCIDACRTSESGSVELSLMLR
jgi:hypothetical protein